MARSVKVKESETAQEEEARSRAELMESLRKARQEYLRSGDPLLDADGLEREIAERRGGLLSRKEVVMARYANKKVAIEPLPDSQENEFQPRTPLGRRLWEIRKRIVASGEPLLDWDDIEREVAERRGGVSESDL